MIVTMLIGLSGSGKSTWAKENCNGNVILSSDAIRKELYGKEEIQDHPNLVFNIMHQRLFNALTFGQSVIYDATNIKRKRRIALIKQIKQKFPDTKIMGVVFVTPFEICVERRSNPHNRNVPREAILKQMCNFQVPYYNEGFDHIHLVKHSQSLADLVKLTIQCKITMHDNPHHKNETIFEHLTETAWNIRYPYYGLGFYHDIGKPLVKQFDDNGIAHYYNHENVSAYYSLFRNVPPHIALSQALIIEYHMRHFSYSEESRYNEWLDTLSDEICAGLLELTSADMEASND